MGAKAMKKLHTVVVAACTILTAGCGPKFDVAVDPPGVTHTEGKKSPVRVHVSATTFEVTGAPFTHCSLRIVRPSRHAFHVDFAGGRAAQRSTAAAKL